MNVLLVEDDAKISALVTHALSQAGYEVKHAGDGQHGLEHALTGIYDILVLDIMLPTLGGLDLLKKLRQEMQVIPTLILSAKGDLNDRLLGFELGADDYLPKPFYVEELVARVRALMARREGLVDKQTVVGNLRLDRVTRQAYWHDVAATLSQKEFSLLDLLMRSPGNIFSRKQILQHVWEINFDPNTNVVDVCIQRIKRKLGRRASLELDPPIESVRGVGYRISRES
jgi:DNA-binding response OmpR family regulator